MQTLTQRSASCSRLSAVPSSGSRRPRVAPCRAADQQQQQAPASTSDAAADASAPRPAAGGTPNPRVLREFKAFGGKVVETEEAWTGPEDQPDFWEGEKFDAFGKALEKYFLPGLVVLGIICGGIAARTYQDDATAYIKTPGSPDDEMVIIDRATVEAVLSGAKSAPSILAE